MTSGRHAAVSAAIAVLCGVADGSGISAAAAFVGGTALDVDHLADYFLNRAGKFTVGRFRLMCEQYRMRRFYLFAHTLEWILPFGAWVAFAGGPPWLISAALGLLFHILLDAMGNGIRVHSYSLAYRVLKGFDSRCFVVWLPRTGLEYWGSLKAFMRGRPEGKARRTGPTRAGSSG